MGDGLSQVGSQIKMDRRVKLALVGVGVIGRRHFEVMRALSDRIVVQAVVDPSGPGFARRAQDVEWFASLNELLGATNSIDGIVLATPNQFHVAQAMQAVAVGCPVLVEKPVATSVAEARRLVEAAAAAQVAVLVGHHRRYNPVIQKARALLAAGAVGAVNTVQASCWLSKPDEYFDLDWRRRDGAGPVMVNAIHDLDLLRYLCGEVGAVQAMTSQAQRGFETEDTATALLQFQSGALGTLTVSDRVAAPWSWELTAGENPAYAKVAQSCYLIGGTRAALSLPDLRLWRHEGTSESTGHWMDPITTTAFPCEQADPLVAQMQHFVEVIRGQATPVVSAKEAMASLAVVEAIKKSAALGQRVAV